MRKVEVCIVGGGIAGLSAARHTRRDTLLIDQKLEIGLPVRCGEGMSIAALKREKIPLLDDFVACRLDSIERFFPGGFRSGTHHTEPHAVILHKDRLEKYLARHSKAEIQLSTALSEIKPSGGGWLLTTTSGIVWAEFVIAADGPASKVRRLLHGEHLPLASATSYVIRGKPKISMPDCGLYFGNTVAPSGYAWIFSKGNSHFNVGVISHRHFNTRKYLQAFLSSKFTDFNKLAPRSGYLPQGGWDRGIIYPNLLFIGDAGGFVDPIFSGGISLALLSGRLAAKAANNANVDQYTLAIKHLPCSYDQLKNAADFLYTANDEQLSELGSFFQVAEAKLQKSNLSTDRQRIENFAGTWEKAKSFVW